MRIPNSLSSRYFFAAAALLPLLLGFSGYSLDKVFHESLLTAEKDALKAHMYMLIGSTEPGEKTLELPPAFAEPRFSSADSGLYAKVSDTNHQTIWRSLSLALTDKNTNTRFTYPGANNPMEPGVFHFRQISWQGKQYYLLSYKTIWDLDKEREFRFDILHTQDTLKKELKRYRNSLWIWLGGMSIILLFSQWLIVRWSLLPLGSLAKDIIGLNSGEQKRLKGDYPREIQPVTDNLNTVLNVEQTQRERYKNTLADLAHSLKTPLAIIQGATSQSSTTKSPRDIERTVTEQVQRMSDIVTHQLQRATLHSHTLVKNKVSIFKLVGRLNQALQKVYQEKKIHFTNNVDEALFISGDENDFMEVFGNLMENAFKYGLTQVCVSSIKEDHLHQIIIEDDGPGIDSNLHKDILKRGARADTATAGQGIGLAVAVDIISSYNGALSTGESSLGGAKIVVALPENPN